MMNDYCVRESTAMANEPMREATVAKWADDTMGALKEANMILDTLFNNIFGPSMEKKVEAPNPPTNCLKDVLALNVEQSRVVVERLAELNARLFG